VTPQSNILAPSDLRLRTTDLKDKIYGILGLARDVEKLAIIPDYRKSTEEVYTEVTARILVNGGFWLLQLCHYNPNSPLPSWVPDLRKDIKETPNDLGGLNKRFQASVSRKPLNYSKSLESIPKVLAIEGICIDTVKEIGDVLTASANDSEDLCTHLPLHHSN
jgi:hypothetical protein